METIPKENCDALLTAMIKSDEGISDLFFVVGKPPHMEVHGKLRAFACEPPLTAERIENLTRVVINENSRLVEDLAKSGSCDCSYQLGELCRFRANIYRQNGNRAMVLRRLQTQIPSLEALQLPLIFSEIIKEKNGLILVTGGTGSGKTTTLAAMMNAINQAHECHVVTLEDPVEFVHPPLKAIFSQRELGRDFYNFPDGLRAALRQAPKVILVGEIRDRDTMEIALTAGETGHVVYSTLHTVSASQTINRILGMFSRDEEQQVRERLSESLRYVVSQRLVPKKTGGRMLVSELMGSSLRTREVISMGETEGRRLADIIEAGVTSGWHSFEQSLLKAFENDLITEETALLYSIKKSAMHQRLDMVKKQKQTSMAPLTIKMGEVIEIPKPVPKFVPPPVIAETPA